MKQFEIRLYEEEEASVKRQPREYVKWSVAYRACRWMWRIEGSTGQETGPRLDKDLSPTSQARLRGVNTCQDRAKIEPVSNLRKCKPYCWLFFKNWFNIDLSMCYMRRGICKEIDSRSDSTLTWAYVTRARNLYTSSLKKWLNNDLSLCNKREESTKKWP